MATIITDEQRISVRESPRFESMVRMSASNHAIFLHNINDPANQSMNPIDWALQRFFVAESILQHPNAQDIEQAKQQYTVAMKGLPIWDGSVDATIDFMIANATFEQMTQQVFKLRGDNVKF